MGIHDDIRIGQLPPIAPTDPVPEQAPPPGYEWKPLATTGRWCLFRMMTEEEKRSLGRQPLGLDEEVDPAIRHVIDQEGARPSSLIAASRRNQRDPMNDLQLLRDLEIINARTVAELGPLPADGLPVQDKRKPQPWRTDAPNDHALHIPPNTDSENDAMKWKDLASVVALGTASTLTACATPSAPKAATSATAPEHKSSGATDAEIGFSRRHTLAEYPDLTPEEMGRRALKLIDSFRSKEDWNVEHIRQVTGLPLAPVKGQEGVFYVFAIELPDSGWSYGINYLTNPQNDYTGVTLFYQNKTNGKIDDSADMAPVCGMDFEAFNAALRNMGFVPEPQYGEYGRLLGIDYTDPHRMFAWLEMMIRSEGYDDEARRSRACVSDLTIRKPR